MGKGQMSLKKVISKHDPYLTVHELDEEDEFGDELFNFEARICDIGFIKYNYNRYSHISALEKYYMLKGNAEANYTYKEARERAFAAVGIFEENLDQLVMGMIWLLQRLCDLAIKEDSSENSTGHYYRTRAKAAHVQKIFDEFIAPVKDQMGATAGRPSDNQGSLEAVRAIRKEREAKILNAMCEMLRADSEDELKIKTITEQVKESRSTLYRWIDESDIDIEELRIEAQKLSRKT
jgi:hypothetical protein